MTAFARTADGRRLALCEWGAPDGAPVVYLHGMPGSRLLRHTEDGYRDAGLRVITYDRPGYGASDRAEGRSVADSADDVAVIADHLGLATFAVGGVSAGGVHALAVAAALPARVTRCVLFKAIAPLQTDTLDWYAGMDPEGAEAFRRIAVGGETAAVADAQETRAWVDDGCPGLEGPAAHVLREALTEAYRRGVAGHVDDWLAHLAPHGFALRSVTAPTRLLAARDDTTVPPGHARWLAAQLPGARLTWVPGGHLDDAGEAELAALAWAGHGVS